MKNINENRPRGTRDIFPPLSIIFQKIYEITSEILNKNNFKQVIFPTFEYTKIFENSIGLSTDIVGKEMFTFLSKSGYSLTLRPEGTVCLARLIKQNKLLKTNFPLKFFYWANMFRYERPQKNRFREFWQLGVELISSSGVVSDYKILKIVSDILTTLNISNFFFRLNYIGNKSTRERYKKELEIFLNSNSEKLCNDCLTRKKKNSLRILDCNLCKKKINFPFYEIVFEEKEKKYLEKLKKYLEYDKIPYKFDYYLVRGLDYYTGLIFEVEVEDNIVLLGGGRYDHDQFFQEKREKKISSIGFAIGIDRVAEFCVKNKLLKINKGIDIFFLVLNEKRYFDIIAWRNFLKKKYTIDYNLEVVKKSKYPKIVKYFSPNLLIFLEEKKDEKLLKIKDCYNNKVFFVNEKEIVKWIDKYFH